MIEYRPCPRRGRVADRAVRRESCRDVVRVRRLLEICRVTRCAVFRRSGKLAVYVTLIAEQVYVRASQSKARHRVVIERSACPCRRGVALLASRREARRHVIRIFRGVEICLMTIHTSGWRAFVLTVHVALRAHERLVRTGQRESRR